MAMARQSGQRKKSRSSLLFGKLLHTIIVSAGTSLEDVRTLVVVTSHKKANAIRPLAITLENIIIWIGFCMQEDVSVDYILLPECKSASYSQDRRSCAKQAKACRGHISS